MEAALATNDYSGVVGPSIATRSISTRHNKRGFLTFSDLHLEKLKAATADQVEKSKLFWFPTRDTTGPFGIDMGTGLLDF